MSIKLSGGSHRAPVARTRARRIPTILVALALASSTGAAIADSRIAYQAADPDAPELSRLLGADKQSVAVAVKIPGTRSGVQVARVGGAVIVQGDNANACGASNCWTIVYRDDRKIAEFLACAGGASEEPAAGHRLMRGGRWLFACGRLVDLKTGQRPRVTVGHNEPISVYDHNGSEVDMLSPDEPNAGDDQPVVISYRLPNPSIAGTIKRGDVLFVGRRIGSGGLEGTAWVYKKGCDPAAYSVKEDAKAGENVRDGMMGIVLRGASPVRARNGCDVVDQRRSGGNAKLDFTYVPAGEEAD